MTIKINIELDDQVWFDILKALSREEHTEMYDQLETQILEVYKNLKNNGKVPNSLRNNLNNVGLV